MANLHTRSNSLPSKSHPVICDVEHLLQRLRSSEGTSTSVPSASASLSSLRDLHEGIDHLIQMPSLHSSLVAESCKKWTNELLERSLKLVDLCGFAREVLSLTKGSVQQLQSSIRRSRGETATADDINAYMISRKAITKMVKKFIKNFKDFEKNTTPFLEEDSDLKAVAEMLKEAEAFDFLVLKSVLMLLSDDEGRSKKRSWSLLSLFTQTSRVKSVEASEVLEQLKPSEVAFQELEEELEAFYRTLLKTRVSLLNVLSH